MLKLDYKILLRYFDLESRYLETREITSESNKLIDKNATNNNAQWVNHDQIIVLFENCKHYYNTLKKK